MKNVIICLLLFYARIILVNGQPGLFAANQPPYFTQNMNYHSILENAPIGSGVYTLHGEDPEGSEVTYGITGLTGTSLFDVNPVTGIVTLKTQLDRESIAFHFVRVTISDGVNTVEEEVKVIVLDVNDNAPLFQNTPYKTTIAEDMPVGSTIIQFNATDWDSGIHQIFTFRFLTDTDVFHVGITSVSSAVKRGTVTLQKPLDYEIKNIYELTVVAENLVPPRLSSQASLIIRVGDVQDSDPVFRGLPYTTSVDENAPIGQLVQTIEASDQDFGVPNEIQYSIVSGNDRELFSLGSATGEIRVAKQIDREAEGFTGSVKLTVQATELGQDGGTFVQTIFTIDINDINDEQPTFDQSEYILQNISESYYAGTLLPLDIYVKDGDQDAFGRFVLSLHGEHSELFRVEPSYASGEANVQLLVEHPLDYESSLQYELLIYANESADPSHYDSTRVVIMLQNENDNRPIFDSQTLTVDIDEDLAVGSSVTMVTAIDGDSGSYGEITYSLTGSDKFVINERTGLITLAEEIDYENSLSYQLNIQAEDGGMPPREANARVTVNIIDVNDNAPVFQRQEYFASIDENTVYLPPDDSVIRFRATDSDSSLHNELTYYILHTFPNGTQVKGQNTSDFSLITIGGSGFLFVSSPVNYETLSHGQIILTVSAEDNDGLADTAMLFLEVMDQNDHSPVFTRSSYNVSVPESLLSGDIVTQVTAVDNDLSSMLGNDSIVYSVSQPSLFRVNPRTGEITTAGFLDREGIDFYSIKVMAVDGGPGDEQKSATTMVYVTITDVNDNNPIFDQVRQTVYVYEDEPIGTVVTNVSASDIDEGINGNVSYSLIGGNTNTAFSIGMMDGEITISGELDYEQTTQVYQLEILAKDQGVALTPATGSATATVTISILDINDNSPEFIYDPDLSMYQFSVSEEADPGVNIGVVTATDMDSGLNSEIDYNITAGNVNGTFNMKRRDSGEIILEKLLDRESVDAYYLQITAMDRGSPRHSAVCDVIITVKDVNDNDPQWLGQPYSTSVSENTPNATYVFQVSAMDHDIGINQELVYEISPDNQYYTVDSESGVIWTTDVPIDREVNNKDMHEIVLTVKDSGRPLRRSPTSATVYVTILDTNDNIPVFENIPYQASIQENLPALSSVFQVTASDPDIGENGTVSYFIVNTIPDGEYFTMDTSIGILRLQQPLDRENISSFTITIEAKDGGLDPNVAMTTVEVDVEDDNDHSPVFEYNLYEVTVIEDAPRKTYLLTVSASDDDIGTNAAINYFIGPGNEDGKFRMDFQSGIVQTAAYLDREAVDFYNLTIEAVDNGVNPRTGTSVILVTVQDINDNQPVFVQSNYDVNVLENITLDYIIISVSATDEDIEENAVITYAIIDGNIGNCFVIDTDTGDVRRGDRLLDRETGELFTLIVEASNAESETLRSTVRVSIRLEDVNDEMPIFTQSLYQRPDLSENAGRGTSVVLVSAEDSDLNQGGVIRYSINSGNSDGKFSIDSKTGLMTTEDELDYEQKRNYTLVVMATDQAPPYHSSVATVIIHIVNTNDEPPSFNQTRYEGTVQENAAIGTPVLKVTAVEYDNQNPIRYEIDPNSNPEAMQLFTIDTVNGMISTSGDIDREVRSFYTISVLANDGGVDKGSTTVWITVVDENDNNPIFDVFSDQSISVEEEDRTPINSVIYTVKATDRDYGTNAQISYAIVSGNENQMFTIVQTEDESGEIRNVKVLDREQQDRYNLMISASDNGVPELSSDMRVTVVVLDINDNIPVFNMSYKYNVTIDENVGGGTPVTTVHANDADKQGLNGLKYYIIDGNTDDTFRMDRNTGEITTRPNPPDRERQDFYNLSVLVEDEDHDQIQQAQIQVLVYIADKNDNHPVFEMSIYSVFITEGSESDGIQVVDTIATDQDLAENAQIVYDIVDGNDYNVFTIGTLTGEISTSKEIDREVIDKYYVVVTATDQAMNENERLTATTTVTVIVGDVNDVAPYFATLFAGPYYIAEDTSGPFVGTFLAMDEDAGANGQIEYLLLGSDEFSISPSDGDLRVKRGMELDREATQVYNITIVASDRGTPPLTGTMIVQVIVSDINDNDPVFEGLPYHVTVSEDIAINSSIYTVSATDNDADQNAHITYSITNGNTDDVFYIDPLSGELMVRSSLDREITGQYLLTITAKDNPENPTNARRDGTELIITIQDINDQTPVFSQQSYSGRVLENAPGRPVTMTTPITSQDADTGVNAVTEYTISGPGSHLFDIDTQTAVLMVNSTSLLDRETEDNYTFTVTASDIGRLNSSAEVSIEILDENDNSPVFIPNEITTHIAETAREGEELTQVSASDKDADINQHVTYRIESGGQDKFTINPNTGLIKIAPGQTLDREEKDTYTLVVIATDRGNPPQSGAGIVTILVDDINDTPPHFERVMQTVEVYEDSAVGSFVALVTAADPDVDSMLQYSIVTVSGFDEEENEVHDVVFLQWFVININSGEIVVSHQLDREMVSTLTLTIAASDLLSVSPEMSSSDPNAVLTIRLLDVNDNGPVFQPDGVTYVLEQLVEHTPVDTVVTTVIAVDADKGSNGMVTYQIIDNITDMVEVKDPNAGVVTISGRIDREDYKWLNFSIRATDLGNPSRSTQIPIYIEVIEVNDNNPEFEEIEYQAAILENATVGTEVLVVKATDPDSGSFGDILYTLAGGGGKFLIDEITGSIILANLLDRESKSEYTLTVTAKDNPTGIPSNRRENSVLVIVAVVDVNDNTPVPTASIYRFDIMENRGPYHLVGIVTASDADGGANGLVLYSIVERAYAEMFEIDPGTGEIFTVEPLDREVIGNDGSMVMTVQIADRGNPPKHVDVTVEVTVLDVNDNSPYFEETRYNVTLSEDDFGGTLVYQFRAIDIDQDQTLSYSIHESHLYPEFTISEQTGALTTVKSLDHESRPDYLLTIRATDQDGKIGSTQLQIIILDTNDQAPLFDIKFYQTSVTENVSIGTSVGTVIATDSDSIRENTVILYYIVDGNHDMAFRVDEQTGEVKTNKLLDREQRAEYELEIEARNLPISSSVGYNNTLNDFATMVVNIEDINDVAPIFTKTVYTRRVLENEQIGTSIITVTAVDLDEGDNGRVRYSIIGGNHNDQFQIEQDSGAVMLAKLFQRNIQIDYQYELIVQASDYGSPTLSSNTTVALRITDVNDRKPIFLFPVGNQSLSIPENHEPGFYIAQIQANDGDLGDNGIVRYDFFRTEGNNEDWQYFYIDEVNGNLYTTFKADRELKAAYTIVLLAKDLGEPQFETTQTVVIHVEDEDDNVPLFPNSNIAQTMSILEHSANGSVVGHVMPAVDMDMGDNAKIFYFIIDGNQDGYFYILKNNGTIIQIKELDREKTQQFVLTVKATNESHFMEDLNGRHRRDVNITNDNLSNDGSIKKVVIEVADINDNGPRFKKKEYTAGLSVDAKYESELITMVARDDDSGNNSIVVYTILNSIHIDTTNDGSERPEPDAFKIGRLDGTVRTNELFVTFYHGYFQLEIQAEDISHHNDSAIIKIYMLKDNQRVKIVFNHDPDTVKDFKEQLISLISNVTGALIHVDDIQYHISDSSDVDFGKTDMLIHAVDPHTNAIMDVTHVIQIIDENYASLVNLFKIYNVIEIVPAIPPRVEEDISLLEAALVTIGILLFIGVFIYIVCICWIKYKHRSKLEAIATFSYGASTSDLLRDSSYQGSNPLWIDNYSWVSDWPDGMSHFEREYEAQELTMDFFHDEDERSHRGMSKPNGKTSLVTFSHPNGTGGKRSVLPLFINTRSPTNSDIEIEMLPPSGDSDTDIDSPGLLSGTSSTSLSEPELNGDIVPMREFAPEFSSRRVLTPIFEEDSSSLSSVSKTDTVKTVCSRTSGTNADDEAEYGSLPRDSNQQFTVVLGREEKETLGDSKPVANSLPGNHVTNNGYISLLENNNDSDSLSDSLSSSSGSDGACQIYHVNPVTEEIGLNIPIDNEADSDDMPLHIITRGDDLDLEPKQGLINNAFMEDENSLPDSLGEVSDESEGYGAREFSFLDGVSDEVKSSSSRDTIKALSVTGSEDSKRDSLRLVALEGETETFL
ncbi:cadherin-23-like [Glandiceps talaboti]